MPKHQTIHSKFHKLYDAEPAMMVKKDGRFLTGRDLDEWADPISVGKILEMTSRLPRYVIYGDLVERLKDPKDSMRKSLKAMIQAGINRLPHPSILVEFDETASGKWDMPDSSEFNIPVRHFVWLHEYHGQQFALPWMLVEMLPNRSFCMFPPVMGSGKMIVQDGTYQGSDMEIGETGMFYKVAPSLFFRGDRMDRPEIKEWMKDTVDIHMGTCSLATSAIAVLLHTKGVVTQSVSVDKKLNKARIARGKEPIRDHTVIRIGHTYNRDGHEVQHVEGQAMPVHWRAGHIRQQRYGHNWEKVRPIFIEPMLVNYVDGEDVPVPTTKEVTV